MMQNLVALVDPDDENSWRKTLRTAIAYARHTRAKLHVLCVVPDDILQTTAAVYLKPADYERRSKDDAGQRLASLIVQHTSDDMQLEQVVRFGSVYKEALRFARDIEADLIIMGSHKRRVADYLLGSNVEQIIRHATASVWVVRE